MMQDTHQYGHPNSQSLLGLQYQIKNSRILQISLNHFQIVIIFKIYDFGQVAISFEDFKGNPYGTQFCRALNNHLNKNSLSHNMFEIINENFEVNSD